MEKPPKPKFTSVAATISSGAEATTTTAAESKPSLGNNDKEKLQSTSNEKVSFDQILHGIFTEEMTMITYPAKTETYSKKKENGKRKSSQQLTLEEEMAKEAARVKELVGAELWNNLEDIDLGHLKSKID